jgi:hypothetical protein
MIFWRRSGTSRLRSRNCVFVVGPYVHRRASHVNPQNRGHWPIGRKPDWKCRAGPDLYDGRCRCGGNLQVAQNQTLQVRGGHPPALVPARLAHSADDRFGNNVQPREWFLVPLQVIDELISRIMDGPITEMLYEPTTASLIEIQAVRARACSQRCA